MSPAASRRAVCPACTVPPARASRRCCAASPASSPIARARCGSARITGKTPRAANSCRRTVAEDEDAGALITATVAEHDDAYHVTQLAIGTQRLIVGSQSAEIGTRLRLRVHARDVAIGLEPPRRSSLLNIIAAHIVEIAQTAQAGHVLVKLEIEGQTLLARITRKSAEGLALRAGMPVYALIKSVALMR